MYCWISTVIYRHLCLYIHPGATWRSWVLKVPILRLIGRSWLFWWHESWMVFLVMFFLLILPWVPSAPYNSTWSLTACPWKVTFSKNEIDVQNHHFCRFFLMFKLQGVSSYIQNSLGFLGVTLPFFPPVQAWTWVVLQRDLLERARRKPPKIWPKLWRSSALGIKNSAMWWPPLRIFTQLSKSWRCVSIGKYNSTGHVARTLGVGGT